MKTQGSHQIAAPASGVSGKGFRFVAVMAATIVMVVFAAGTATAQVRTQNVNVGNARR